MSTHAPRFPGYEPVGEYYSLDYRDLYHDQFLDDECDVVPCPDPEYILVRPVRGGWGEWHGDASEGRFMGQPPPDTWVMRRRTSSLTPPASS